MIRHHLMVSSRYLFRHKRYTAINMGGLAVGLGSCLLIAYFLYNEFSFDHFHERADHIYRINTIYSDHSGSTTQFVNTPPALVPGITGVIPELKKATRLRFAMRSLLEKGDRSFYEDQGFYADSSFLEVFSFRLKEGDTETALDQSNAIVLTEELAAKYFEEDEPMGELMILNNDLVLRVTGILEAIPKNSHLQFDFLVSFSTYSVPPGVIADLSSWGWLGFLTYVQLEDGADIGLFEKKINQLYQEKLSEGMVPHQALAQPLKDIYLGSHGLVDDLASHIRSGNRFTVYALGIIALLILLIACFNFMNLTTAISLNRGKEIGLRKVLGADKRKLVFQLLNESVLIALASLVLAYALGIFAFSYLKEILELELSISWKEVLISIPIMLVVTILLGMGAGAYPSFMLTGIKAVHLLKGGMKPGTGVGSKLRNTLIIFQFCISISLLASTIVVTRQVQYMRDQSLGFDRENIIVIKMVPQDMTRYYEAFSTRLLQNSHVVSVSRSSRLMGDPWPLNPILLQGQNPLQTKMIMGNLVGYDFLKTMGIKLKEGRSFSREFADDPHESIMISEKAVEHLGLDDPIGERLSFFGNRTVIGVVEDFNFSSLHHAISPVAFIMPFIDLQYMYVRLTPGNIAEKIAALESTWQQIVPTVPLDIQFMDDHLNQLYNKEERLSYLIGGFSILAVVLACMGLYGLVAFMVSRRLREVSIRKVLGASLSSLMLLFSRQYMFLIGMGALMAVPGGQYVLSQWLENFAYRIEVSWWVYPVSTLALIIISLLTISQQTIKAVMTNPAKILRNE